jgi:hypothetical protein
MYLEDLSDFQQIWDFSKTKCQENSSSESPVHTYGRKDGPTDKKLIGVIFQLKRRRLKT